MCDYVDYPKKCGHGFVVLCSIFAVSHILVDSWDFFTQILLCCFDGGVGYIQSKAYFRHFHRKYLIKNWFSLVFYVHWYKLTSKPSEANSGTYANIYQGFISNLGLNHMQYAVFTSNQTKNVWFVPLIRNMNCAITYTYIHKKLSCL